jgi:hypothetical protein
MHERRIGYVLAKAAKERRRNIKMSGYQWRRRKIGILL